MNMFMNLAFPPKLVEGVSQIVVMKARPQNQDVFTIENAILICKS